MPSGGSRPRTPADSWPVAGLLLGQAVLDLLQQVVAALVHVQPGRADLLRAFALALEVGGLGFAGGQEDPYPRGTRLVADHDLLVALLALEVRVEALVLEAGQHGGADVGVVGRGVVGAEPAPGQPERGRAPGRAGCFGPRRDGPAGGRRAAAAWCAATASSCRSRRPSSRPSPRSGSCCATAARCSRPARRPSTADGRGSPAAPTRSSRSRTTSKCAHGGGRRRTCAGTRTSPSAAPRRTAPPRRRTP